MADQNKPMSPEVQEPVVPEINKSETAGADIETAEQTIESGAEKEKSADLEARRQNLAAGSKPSKAQSDQDAASASIEEKKEAIIDKLVKEAIASNFNEAVMEQIMKKAAAYLEKGFPDIADALHDRIMEEKARAGRG